MFVVLRYNQEGGKITVLTYHNPIYTVDNLTLSVDNIVLDFFVSSPPARDGFMKLLSNLPILYAVNVVHWDSFRIGTYREQFSIQMQDGTSFWLGAALNGAKTYWGRVRLDFNPNKIAHHEAFQTVLSFLLENTRPAQREIRRFDLAIDIPTDRQDVFLVKDNRAYIERRHGKELTQYLGGKSNTAGRVKLYNKQVEAKLPRPLTRLELTLDPEVPYEQVKFPKVYYLDDLQVCFDDLIKITDTENFILNALLQGCGTINQLGRKTREKMELILQNYVRHVSISEQDYEAVLQEVYTYIDDNIRLSVIDEDQPPAALPY